MPDRLPPIPQAEEPRASLRHNSASDELIVSVARDLWRLRMSIEKAADQGEIVPKGVTAAVERLMEDLEVAGVDLVDPRGQLHAEGALYEIALVEQGGDGTLLVSETVSPGVRRNGVLLARPTVILSHKERI